MKLFAAVLPSPPVAHELAQQVRALHALPGADRLRWANRDGWHLTLAFYGEVGDDVVPELSRRLQRAAERRAPCTLRLEGGGRFSDSILWTGVGGAADDLAALVNLAGGARAAGRKVGLEMEERSYHPHLTLARQRRRGGVDLRLYTAALSGFTSVQWDADTLALVRSHPPEPGIEGAQPRYEAVAAWPLGGGG